ncbi:trichohyalin isoform X1 [Sphaeramia orbicularis]|uniref:trichohyalin isoform X1 n=1 Tax=Sphaeramia orbicularis TaxID=375764 RepID=UPI0011815C87|nr:trichohyalin-like isoform X1 [Sphaeramia orbicularis]
MAAQVEVQATEVGRTVTGGRLHLSPLTDSSNKSLIEISSMNQSHIISSEPNKPVPGPKPRLTPKPFAVEKNPTIKPILAPKPHPKPRPESTRLAGYKPDLPSSPKPQQPVGTTKPRPISTNPSRPAPTSFITSTKLNAGQSVKPVAQPFKPAPPLDVGDPTKPIPLVPAEKQKPGASSLSYSKSLKRLPAAEWSGTTKKDEEKDPVSPSKVGPSMTRAKSMGFLAQIGQEEEREEKPKPAAVPLRPQPRGGRPRPVSAIFPGSPVKAESPVSAPSRVERRPLSADLTARFESIGLSLHRKSPKVNLKENTPEAKVQPQKREQEKPLSSTPQSADVGAKAAVPDQSNKTTEETSVKETDEEKRGARIKSRISLLLDSSFSAVAPAPGQGSDVHSPVQPPTETEPAVGVKQLIKQLTVDTTPTQSPAVKPVLKPRPLPLDLTKRFSSERSSDLGSVSLSETTDRHEISKGPQKRIEESVVTPSDMKMIMDLQDSQKQIRKPSMPEGPDLSIGTTSKESNSSSEVQTVRASLFENVVEKYSVLMVDDNKYENKASDSPSSPLPKKMDDEGKLVTATYKEPPSPSSPVRVLHAFDTVHSVEENRAVSENVPPAQWEDKAMTLRSRRSEGSKPAVERTDSAAQGEPVVTAMPEQQPRYLRVGALPKWTTADVSQEAGLEKGMMKGTQREGRNKNSQREADQEDVYASDKHLKMLQAEEQLKPRATYFALTGQMQETPSLADSGTAVGDMTVPFDDSSSQWGSQVKVLPLRRNPSLNEAFSKPFESPDQVEKIMRGRATYDGQTAEEIMEGEKKREPVKEMERHKGQLKELDRETQRQLEMEKQALLQFVQMKERDLQRDFERQRQRAFEKEKQEFEEKQRALEMQKQIELEKQKIQEYEREKQRELERERQRQLEKERRRELERQKQRELEKERQRELERQKKREEERQKELEKERQRELERQKKREEERQRELEKERQKKREEERQKELEKERQRELERQKKREEERQRELEKERQKKREEERQKELEKERQRELERQRQKEEERQKELDKERKLLELQREKQRIEEMERIKELERKQLIEFQKMKQKEKERQQILELEKQRLREKMEREEAEKMKQMALEHEMLRLRELEKEREKQKEIEKQRELEQQRQKERERLKEIEREKQREMEQQRQRDLERERQKQLDLENQRLKHQELEKERQRKEDLERIKEMERRQLLELERQKQAERERQQILELEKRRLREKMEREEAEKMRHIAKQQEAERQRLKEKQKKEEQERVRLETSSLRPKVVDLDSVLRVDPCSKAASQRGDPSTRWKEPSAKAEQPYRPGVLDLDSFTSQTQLSPARDLFPVSGIQGIEAVTGARAQVPSQTSVGFSSPVWTMSPQDPWELRQVEMSVDKPEQTRKNAGKPSPEQLLLKQEERHQSAHKRWSGLLDEPLHLALIPGLEAKTYNSPAGVSSSFSAEQIWLPREPQPQESRGDAQSHRRSQGSQELNRMRSRSVSRRSAPSSSAIEGSLSRVRSRSAHREQSRHSWVQQKPSVSGEDEGKDSETPVHETDSQYGTWETGLRTDDSLTPATPSSESNLSPSPRKPTPPHTPGEHTSLLDPDTVDAVPSSSSSESQPLSFPDAPTTLLDTSALRSRAQLGKKRAPRTRPTRAARQNAAQAALADREEESAEDWLYRDSTEEKAESKNDDSGSADQAKGADASPAVASQPQRVALFPGMDPSALKAQLKKRSDSDNQTDAPAPSPSQISRSPKSPFLPRAARVLPPPGGKENGEEDSPQWLKELKSKKRLSQYENES